MLLIFRQLWEILDGLARRQLVLLSVMLSLVAILEALGIGSIIPLLQIVTNGDRMSESAFLMTLHRWLGEPSTRDFTIILALLTLGLFVGKNLFSLLVIAYQFRFVWDTRSRLASKLYTRYLNSSYQFHMTQSSAKMQRNVTLSMDEIFGGMMLSSVLISGELVVIVGTLLVLLVVDPWPTLAVMVLFGGTTVAFYIGLRNRLSQWGGEHEHTNGEIISNVSQAFRLIKDIKAGGHEGYFATVLKRVLVRNCMARRRYQFATSLPRLMLETLAIAVMLLGVVGLLLLGRSPGDVLVTLGLFGVVAFRLMPSLNRLAGYASNLRVGRSALLTIHSDLTASEVGSAERVGATQDAHLTDALSLKDVHFRYAGADQDALSGVGLTIRRGASVALVGPSGAGKTTLVDLLLGLIDPTQGDILIDGRSVLGLSGRWRRNVGYVPQEVFLMDGTLRANIALGLAPEEVDEDRLAQAIALSQLGDVVSALPAGLDTLLGEGAANLSGGQRQRVGIARALYHDPDILIMDEATSALDAGTEDLITRAIESLHGDKTLIIVAHRLSTVKRCNVIHFMRDGRIEDSGDFGELSARHPGFAHMVKLMGLTDEQ
ncbi:ABC transporter ATP-binding protein [Magnetospirillum aberrantis]|uniref:ABC transporter ATP-binding protein n=1 Tax=Magnetospirillum aberrantis SpK TaxID=908842 RepID=A0A7C9QRK5_9PROT|nr:ABC transporter ATP-binding protein [Magnetospirillum aberrantis]NFV78559.1 ABC transporter ATP-binding protein [Magnetospirillum aberrantis SpK]